MKYLKHIYFGNGKGKTTAAIGAAVRASGSGMRVLFVQFLKGMDSSEIVTLKKMGIDVIRTENTKKFFAFMNEKEKEECRKEQESCLRLVKAAALENKYEMIVLDEVLDLEKITGREPVEDIMRVCENAELILTGHTVWEKILEYADYVSEVKCIKHPFDKGIKGRKGIEF